jgi:sec-independent protein translocase protein TatC
MDSTTESHEDDLFRNSTMTFGQHLAELRTCLVKSAIGLLIGFIIGLTVGGYVVQFIQRPLSRALTTYYQKESVERVEDEIQRREQSGHALPLTAAQAENRVLNEKLLADEVYIDPKEMFQELKKAYPDQFKHVELPQPKTPASAEQPTSPDKEGLLRLFLWHRSEDDPRMRIKSLNAQEAFGVYVKASLLVGILAASPWIFFQIWNFVAAGLYPRERYYVHIYLPFSIGLFLLGAALAFFVVFEPVLKFLLSFNRSLGIDPDPRINEWLGFVLLLPVGFGLGFQLPLVMLFMERIGVFTVKNYLAQWRIAVLVIFAVAAVLTPPDPTSMLLLAFSLTFLYFGGIVFCKLLPRHSNPFGDEPVPPS